jgi:hypothetical protein
MSGYEEINASFWQENFFVPWTWLAFPFFPVPEFFHSFRGRGEGKGEISIPLARF